jgi:hypothetical protein
MFVCLIVVHLLTPPLPSVLSRLGPRAPGAADRFRGSRIYKYPVSGTHVRFPLFVLRRHATSSGLPRLTFLTSIVYRRTGLGQELLPSSQFVVCLIWPFPAIRVGYCCTRLMREATTNWPTRVRFPMKCDLFLRRHTSLLHTREACVIFIGVKASVT